LDLNFLPRAALLELQTHYAKRGWHPTNRPHLAHILTAQTDTATTLSRSARGLVGARTE